MKKVVITGLLLISLTALVFSWCTAWRSTLSAAVAINLLVPEGEGRPLLWITGEPKVTEVTVNEYGTGDLKAKLWQPKQRAEVAMVIYTPFVGGGVNDARLINLAETWARAGYVVAVPWRENKDLVVSSEDIEDVAKTVELLQTKVSAVGLFGISYGSGPTIAVAAKDDGNNIPFVVSLNGFYDLNNFVRFITTGQYSYGDIVGQREPHLYTSEILDNTLAAAGSNDLASFMASKSYAEMHRSLSPALWADNLTAEVFIIHSTDDSFIPFTESVRLHDHLRVSGQTTRLVLTDVIEHGTYRPMNMKSIGRYYIPAGYDFFRLIGRLLRTH